MSEQVPPPVPPVSTPQPQQPRDVMHIPPAVAESAPAPSGRSGASAWWLLGVLVVAVLVMGSCALPVLMLAGGTEGVTKGGEGVAVIRIDGPIAGVGDGYGDYVTPEGFFDTLDKALEDDSVKAIVLRVDSPGGTVAASQEIARYVKECEKPVVVSSGDVNASGAYMISSQADEIWALPGTAVGSIGVIAQIPNVSGLLDKVGVEFTTITAGKNKDTGSPYRPLTKEERALIQGEVDEAYDQFIDIVAEGRNLKRSEVASLATGWTWSGERAAELGLVDHIGTYRDALDAAAEAGGITGDYDIITYDDTFGDFFRTLMGLTRVLSRLEGAVPARPDTGLRERLPR